MAAAAAKTLLLSTLLTLLCIHVRGWDSDDFELFDLVEEVNANFYEVFGIDQSATTSEVRKAYRQLSLKLHPDKNDAEDAEEKFRQIVAIYEVLKDEKKRERYNQVLVEGLPDWRQPVFYYRRARKMGIYELAVVLFIILTIGHYFVAWGVYIEKRLVMEEYVSTKKKKEKKKKKQAMMGEEEDEDEEIKSIPTPRVLDLWPFQLTVFLFHTVRNLPQTLRNWQEERERRREEEEAAKLLEEEDDSEEFVRKPKKRVQLELPEYTKEMSAKYSTPTDGKRGAVTSDDDKKDSVGQKKGQWTDEEIVLLSKAVNKFPGGTHQRWEKIADMVGRTVAEVTAKAKENKGNYIMHLNSAVQSSVSSQKSSQISDGIITQTSDKDDLLESGEEGQTDSQVRKRQKPTKIVKTAERTLLISQRNETQGANCGSNKPATVSSSDVSGVNDVKLSAWTQNQQTIFEWALKQYPKGTDKRWDLVAEHIPGKSKEDCIARFKELATLLSKRKKQQDAKQS